MPIASIELGFRICLAAVLVAAAAGKLADRSSAIRSLAGFGVGNRLARPLAVALPLAELAVAGALLPATTARPGAVAATALLTVFATVLAVTLARGERPDCGCFGRLHPSPIGPATLVRTLALLAVAVWLSAQPHSPASATAWLTRVGAREALVGGGLAGALALGVANGLFALALLRQNGRLLRRVDALERGRAAGELAIGEQAPSLALRDYDGSPVEVDELVDPLHGLVLLFADPGCSSCASVLAHAEWARARGVPVAVVGRNPWPDLEGYLVDDWDGMVSLGVIGLPGAVGLGPSGEILATGVIGSEDVERLLARFEAAAPRLETLSA